MYNEDIDYQEPHMKNLFRGISPVRCLLALLASAVLAFGLYNVHAQASVTEGGVLGLSLFLDVMLGVSPAVSTALCNLLCYLFGAKELGRKFIVYSFVSTVGFSLFYALFECFPPLFPEIAAYPLVSAVTGALFVGVGCGVCVRIGGAPSGDDALAMALSHKTRLPISLVYLSTDALVLGLSLLYIPFTRIFYSLITVLLSGQLIGLIERIGRKDTAMPNYRIVATDLDGTLLNTRDEVSPENLAAIAKMEAAGVFVVPSSGRTLGEIPASVRDIPDVRYIIHSDGAVIYDKKEGRALDARCMSGDVARRMLDLFYSYETLLTVRAGGVLYVAADEQTEEIYDSYRMIRAYQTAMLTLAVPKENFKEFCYSLPEIEMVCTFFRHDEELAACREAFLADGRFGVAASTATNLEVFSREAGKGNALLRLADLLSVPHESTVAVGDSENDLDNLRHAHLALAMANATDAVKAAAHRTVCHNDEHVMAYIYENIIQKGEDRK